MVREGSAPNFCPPTEEGITITLVDEKGEQVELEFLGLVLKGESSFGFFFPVDDEHPATSSGEVVVLEAGIGGRLDSTNIVKDTLAAVICSIGRRGRSALLFRAG